MLACRCSVLAKANACSQEEGQMPTQKPPCPKCNSEKVKAITRWRMAEPPHTIFTCSSCRHEWPQQSDDAEAKYTARTTALPPSIGHKKMPKYSLPRKGTNTWALTSLLYRLSYVLPVQHWGRPSGTECFACDGLAVPLVLRRGRGRPLYGKANEGS